MPISSDFEDKERYPVEMMPFSIGTFRRVSLFIGGIIILGRTK